MKTLGRTPGATKPKMTKLSRMVCARCGRPLSRAAALMRGQPVGPACAAIEGLLTSAQPTSVAQADTVTMDLFWGQS